MKGGEFMKHNTTGLIVIALVIAGVSFFGGMKYQESKRPTLNRQFTGNPSVGGPQGQRTGGFAGRGGNGFRPVTGEILSMDEMSITVKLMDGSSKIVLVTEKTEINKADQAKKEDLKPGEKVAVFGTDNSDGSVTAQNIQLNPIVRIMGGSPSASPKP
jgi:hypothetical protein